jgi:hypothetical protein
MRTEDLGDDDAVLGEDGGLAPGGVLGVVGDAGDGAVEAAVGAGIEALGRGLLALGLPFTKPTVWAIISGTR